jgi:fatty acid desaturase
LVSLSLERCAALGSESSLYYQIEIPDALFLVLLVLALLLDVLLVLLVLVLLGVPQLSYHLFAVLVVVLANTLSGLLFHLAADDSVADDSVADDMGKYHFLA